jgi:hypothetical protein
MSYLIWYNLTVLKVQKTVCGNVISIHAVCVLFYKFISIQAVCVLFYKFISIHAVCVLFYKYSCGMCFIL